MSPPARGSNRIKTKEPKSISGLFADVYDELRRLAKRRLSFEKPGQTLDATGLVHEVYLRLLGSENRQNWTSHRHFCGAAATAMRRILVERARRKNSLKLGGAMRRVDALLEQLPAGDAAQEVEEIDHYLEVMKAEHPTIVKLVELKYFAGFTLEESAGILDISTRTAYRYWAFAKAWLYDAISDNPAPA